jgi:hypothetical protein
MRLKGSQNRPNIPRVSEIDNVASYFVLGQPRVGLQSTTLFNSEMIAVCKLGPNHPDLVVAPASKRSK